MTWVFVQLLGMVWFSYFFVGYIHTLDVGEGFSGDLFLMFPEKKTGRFECHIESARFPCNSSVVEWQQKNLT